MKLLVFAHTPPPHHGQSYMVQVMLEGFGGNRRKRAHRTGSPSPIQCYHVNAQLSHDLEDIGDFRVGKFLLLLWYCLEAVWCRFRHGVTNFYYIPAPGKPSALYRDWLVMFICRPFFKRIILHWHAAGLAKWLETVVQMRSRSLTYRFMKQVDLSIVLSKYNQADAEKIFSRRIQIVSNGIPDPCPDFAAQVLPSRQRRFALRQRRLSGAAPATGEAGDAHVLKVLYLAHCTEEKGLFDTLEGVRLLAKELERRQAGLQVRLLVAGTFVNEHEKARWQALTAQPEIAALTQSFGFVSGKQKDILLREADVFCFPTFYQNENQPVNLIEAMAYGLPILTTRWRSIPELFPAQYPGLVDPRSPDQIARTILHLATVESGEAFRDIFDRGFTLEKHLAALREALLNLEREDDQAAEIGATVNRATVRR
jgi:glycosyltransferase involved in cell wall biosynthesis